MQNSKSLKQNNDLLEINSSKKRKNKALRIAISAGLLALGAAGAYIFTIRKLEKKFFNIKELCLDGDIIPKLKEVVNEINLSTKNGGKVNVWDINPEKCKKYIVMCDGFGSDKLELGSQEFLLDFVNKAKGYGVIDFDYLGWGKSSGEIITQKSVHESLETVFDYLHSKGIKNDDISLVGHSLGCGAACDYAKDNKVSNIILVNPFNKLKSMIKRCIDDLQVPKPIKKILSKIPESFIPIKNKFNNEKALKNISCPTLIIHSKDDKTIPVQFAQTLYNKTKTNSNINYTELATGDHFFTDEKTGLIIDFLASK